MFSNLTNVPPSAMAGPEYADGVRACARLFAAVMLIACVVGGLNVAAGSDAPAMLADEVIPPVVHPTAALVDVAGR